MVIGRRLAEADAGSAGKLRKHFLKGIKSLIRRKRSEQAVCSKPSSPPITIKLSRGGGG
jgi:hypothetical protein